MKSMRYGALLAVVALCNFVNVSAQDRPNRGNFNREEMRERMMSRIREEMDVKDDADWKPISDRISKVMEARREVGNPGMNMGALFRRQRGDGGDQAGDGGGRRRGGPGFGEPSPEAQALQKAVESKASNEELKAKMAKYREAQKARRDALEKAQDDLRKVLSLRQEAAAVSLGLLE